MIILISAYSLFLQKQTNALVCLPTTRLISLDIIVPGLRLRGYTLKVIGEFALYFDFKLGIFR